MASFLISGGTLGLLLGLLGGIQCIQIASVAFLPFSGRAFRRINRWCANTWWGWCVLWAEKVLGIRFRFSGDPIPPRENALVIANHQQMADILVLMSLAFRTERLGDMKWFVKDVVKYVPGVGWGMLFLDCLFVKRDWTRDAALIERAFARLKRNRTPYWLVTFVEGTRITRRKLDVSQRYAREKGMPEPRNVMIPRTKGFAASLQGLGDTLDAVYDVTIGYPDGVPTLLQYCAGEIREVHVHARRFPKESLPGGGQEAVSGASLRNEAQLSAWLLDRFREKDQLLENFYRTRRFPSERARESSSFARTPAAKLPT